MTCAQWVVITSAWLAGTLARAGEVQPEPDPIAIVNGEDVESCAWPSVVGLVRDDTLRCTGALVHPEIVLTAAHCLPEPDEAPIETVVFGEDVTAPARTVDIVECVGHPDFVHSTATQLAVQDFAFCRLAERVEDVRIITPLMGCEEDIFLDLPLTAVTVGFGDDEAWYDDTGVDGSGAGIKRLTTNPIIALEYGGVTMSGNSASGGCFGDSGGPGIVQLADGTFRVFGVLTALLSPAGSDPCVGAMNHYTQVGPRMAWFENESGFDLTPCHDADGAWNPDERCTEFPTTPYEGQAEWSDGCAKPDDLSDPIASCGAPFPFPEPGGSSSSSAGGDGDSGSSTSIAGDPSTSSTSSSDDDDSEGTSSGAPDRDDGGEGCGCTATPRTRAAGCAVVFVGCRRRRRNP